MQVSVRGFLLGEAPSHPLRVMHAWLRAGQLEFHYTLNPPVTGAVTGARLVGPAGQVAVQPAAPGVLRAPVPGQGGRLVLAVDALSDPLPPGAPPLPWEVGVYFPPGAAADWHGADPCGAALALPGGGAIRVVRVARHPDRTVVFWQWEGPEPGPGHLNGVLLAGHARYWPETPPYDYNDRIRGPVDPGLPLPGQPGGPDLPVTLEALRFPSVPPGEPLALQVRMVEAFLPGGWRLEFPAPAGRPAALAPDLATSLGALTIRLAEVWARARRSCAFPASRRWC